MKSFICFLPVLMTIVLTVPVSATTVAGWLFDDQDEIVDVTSTYNTLNAASSSGLNRSYTSGYGGYGYAISHNTLAERNVSYIQFPIDTTGFSGISFRYSGLASNTASRYWKLQYSITGEPGPYTDAGSVVTQPAGAWTVNNSFNLAGISGINNNPSVVFRIVATDSDGGDDSSGNWWQVNSTIAPAASGTYRVDRVFIEANQISIPDISACGNGTSVEAVVTIQTGIPVNSFGFTVTFDPSMLTFTGCVEGDLTAGWTGDVFFSCAESAGVITVGGASMYHEIPAESAGSIAGLIFTVHCGSCSAGDTGNLTLGNLVDDFQGWMPADGIFSYYSDCLVSVPAISGCNGQIQVPVSISGNRPIDTFSFHLVYDPAMLAFNGTWEAGSLTGDWIMLSCNEISPGGQIIVVGSTHSGGTPVLPLSNGSLILLDFNITCNTCYPYQSAPLSISDPEGGLLDFGISQGSFTYDCPVVEDAIVISDAAAMQAQTVNFVIGFTDSPEDVDEFGFDISFCTDMLSYQSFQAGDLVSDWSYFDCNNLSPGILRIGGFHTSPISAGSTGSLVQLNFQVDCPGCAHGQTCPISMMNMVDDITYWHVHNGQFTYLEATPTASPTPAESPTPMSVPASAPAGIAVLIAAITAFLLFSVCRQQV